MRYNMQTGQVVLKGEPGQPVPRVVNDQMQVDANEIEMNVEGSKLKAMSVSKPVQSIMFPVKPESKSTRRTPGLMKQDQPVNGLSRELSYTGGDASTLELIGAATLVQGEKAETNIKAEKITVDRENRQPGRAGLCHFADDGAGCESHEQSSRDEPLDRFGPADATTMMRSAR